MLWAWSSIEEADPPDPKDVAMRRKVPALTALMAVVGASLFLLVPAASAQTGYPPGPCTVFFGDSGNLGSVNVGSTIVVNLRPECLFSPPGSAVSIVVNGENAGTKPAKADGSVDVSINALSATRLAVNPEVSGRCGRNDISATGPSEAARRNVTQVGNITVVCPTSVAATPVRGRVAFTGGNILRWGGVALFLVAIGAGLVIADRRRGRKQA